MPTPKQKYYSTKDIETVLNISRSKAIQLMHMFGERGQLLREGNTLRVEIKVFEAWWWEQTQRSL